MSWPVTQCHWHDVMKLCCLFAALLCLSTGLSADQTDCDSQLEQSFTSGAQWRLCVNVNEQHGLELSTVAYRAPGDTSRSVMQKLHLGQILMHYHDSAKAIPQLNSAAGLIPMSAEHCAGESHNTRTRVNAFCSELKDNRTLAKYAQRPSLHSSRWVLSSAFSQGTLTWTVSYSLTEDGQIQITLRLSGRASQRGNNADFAQAVAAAERGLSRATILANWRMVFDLDTADHDYIESFDFPLDVEHENRRPMQLSRIDTESLHTVQRDSFRGWRIVDSSGAGYYLDPANSGYAYNSQSLNWAQFDLAVSRLNECETLAVENPGHIEDPPCGKSLDDFINGESLLNTQAVLWYNQTRSFDPGNESWPVIRDVELRFDLLPFDWTATSPFSLGH